MTDQYDFELLHEPAQTPPPEPPRRSVAWEITAVIVAAAVIIATYFAFGRRPVPPPLSTTASPKPAADQTRPLGGEPQAIQIPPLEQSDPTVRMLVQQLSSHPIVASWLTTNDLIRNFASAVSNIADSTSPAKQLGVLRPKEPFRTAENGGKAYIDPRSYNRYTKVADAVASIDPVGAARLYATLKPRIEEAATDLGIPGQFDRVLEKAIVTLLATPTSDRPLEVFPNVEGIGYAFSDGSLEKLSLGQKALIRMGPANARIVKTRLREIALALGIPSTRLPA